MRSLRLAQVTLLLLVSVGHLPAQTASVTRYGSPCPAVTAVLTTQGLPQLGTTFKVTGLKAFGFCTRVACSGCRLCNTCGLPSLLFLGAAQVRRPIVLSGVAGSGCFLLARPDFILPPDSSGEVSLQIPSAGGLVGFSFYLQRADMVVRSTVGSLGCAPGQEMSVLTAFSVSDGVQATIGL